MKLGRLGVWYFTDRMTAAQAADFARRVESLGYAALWLPEAVGRDPFAHAALLLAATERLILATGIASIYARDANAMVAAQNTLAEQSGDRFLLGMGVSHAPMVEQMRGHSYGKPVSTMRAYLDRMDQAPYAAIAPGEKPPRVIAALGPAMLALARERCSGAHPYLVPPEHTARAREILGPDAWSRSCCSKGMPRAPAASPARPWPSTWPCPTTATTCCAWALRTRTSTTGAATC